MQLRHPAGRCNPFPLALALPFLALIGCAPGSPSTAANGTMHIFGNIHGGQQPVSGSSMQLYNTSLAAGSGAALPMLRLPVRSDAQGGFDITSDYNCANSEDQVLLVAQGGNPGMAAGTDNAALTMVAAIGRCGDLTAASQINISEITTVAAAWALSPFFHSATNVLTSPTNKAGLRNAYLNAHLLSDLTTGGLMPSSSSLTFEGSKMLALANSLASCINSAGGSACAPLFTAATIPGGTAPTDTFTAALNIVQHPGNQVAAVYNAGSAAGPFGGALTRAPTDWTMSISITGGGLDSPDALAIDQSGNVWVANYAGTLSAFSPQGTALTSTGYGSGVLSRVSALTIDPENNVWATIGDQPRHGSTSGSIAKFSGAMSGSPGQFLGSFYDNALDYPSSLASDSNGNILVANYTNSLASIYSSQGTLSASGLGAGYLSFPLGIAVDASHGFWLANYGDGTITHLDANGRLLARPQCCDGASAIALDSRGNAWVADYYAGSVSEVSASGTLVQPAFTGGGIEEPGSIAIDGAQDVWIANYYAGSISHLAGNRAGVIPGTALSPAASLGADAHLVNAAALAIDSSGDLWIADGGRNLIVEFLGQAAPTKTPLGPVPSAP